MIILSLNKNAIIILVYDIDVEKTDVLEENLRKMADADFKVYHIQSVKNFVTNYKKQKDHN